MITKAMLEKENASFRRRVAKLEKQIARSVHSELALHSVQQNLQALIENSDATIWWIDPQYRLIMGNALFQRATQALLGQEVAPGDNLCALKLPQAVLDEWQSYYDRALRGESFVAKARTRFASQARTVEYRFHPIQTPEGQITGVSIIGRDTTERKNAEDKLRASEQTLKVFVEYAPSPIAMFDRDMKYLAVSRRYIQDYNLHQSQIVGMSHYIVFPEISEAWKEIHRRCLNGAVEHSDEEAFVRADGAVDWVRWEIRPWYDPQGVVGGLILFSEVITERKEAELALKVSEAKFSAVFHSSPLCLGLHDAQGKYIDVNQASCDLVGLSREEIIGKTSAELGTIDTQVLAQVNSKLAQTGGVLNNFEVAIRSRDGRVRDVMYSVKPLILNGAMYRLGVALDITERKQTEQALHQSEEKYSNLFSQAAIPAVLVQLPENLIVDINLAFERTFGYGREELLGIHWGQAGWANSFERTRVSAEFRLGHLTQDNEYVLKNKAGETQVVSIRANIVEFGGHRYAIATIQDITARKRAEEQLQSLSRRLVEMQETERRALARELHDEIGQALTAIKMNLQSISPESDSDTRQTRLAESIRIVERTLRQTRDLSLDLRPSLLDDFGLVPALEWFLKREGERSNIAIALVVEPRSMRLPALLETTCYRIVQSAITNVVRHAHAKHARVELRQDGRKQIELIVYDDGVGFNVTEAFEQARRGQSMGLVTMQERAQLVGGEIEFTSMPENGTRIRARFQITE